MIPLLARPVAAALLLAASPVLAEAPGVMTVTKSPSCGCCSAWVAIAEGLGYEVETVDVTEVADTKVALGVPEEMWACHTATVGGYVVEGHVPFEAVEKLLAERPDVVGIAVPGMPMGSPGMGDDPSAVYDVIAWGGEAGAGEVFHTAGEGS